jgi:hypothetical protein
MFLPLQFRQPTRACICPGSWRCFEIPISVVDLPSAGLVRGLTPGTLKCRGK